MNYKVIYSPRVRADIREHVRRLIEDEHVSPVTVERWYKPLFEAINNLYDMPRLYPVDEPYSRRRGVEVRKLTYKKYIVRYRVDDDTRTVNVISFFHGSRRREA
ncbi:MAG: type II toxin-antitoxin system RelE/ParE family toxin [Planctomycetota bacterium]